MDTLSAAAIKKIAGLVEQQREHLAKIGDLNSEIVALLGGGAGVGEHLKAIREHFDHAWGVRYAGGETGRYVWSFAKAEGR